MKPEDHKNNLSGDSPRNEANPHDEPKIKGKRREVWSVFFGGIAGLALWIAGIAYSANQNVAIIWLWLAGVLGMTSWCFFWAAREEHGAIVRVWTVGSFLVSLSCLYWYWASSEQPAVLTSSKVAPADTSIAREESSPRTSPRVTPSVPPAVATVGGLKFTPKQVFDRISREPTAWDRGKTKQAFERLRVDWTLFFSSADRIKLPGVDKLLVTFRDDSGALVKCVVPFQGHENLQLTDKTQKFRIRGVIELITEGEYIGLKEGAVFESVFQ